MRAAFLSLATATMLSATACSDAENGTPELDSGGQSTQVQGSEPSTVQSDPSDANNGAALAELDPCSLLETQEIQKHAAVVEPQNDTIGSSRSCNWDPKPTGDASLRPSVAIALRETGGVQVMNDLGRGVQHTTENGRDYGRTPGPNGCVIGIGVTGSSRVDVIVSGVPTEKACGIANSLTDLAEPNVPRG